MNLYLSIIYNESCGGIRFFICSNDEWKEITLGQNSSDTSNGFSMTELWKGSLETASIPIILSDNVTNFKLIQVISTTSEDGGMYNSTTLCPCYFR